MCLSVVCANVMCFFRWVWDEVMWDLSKRYDRSAVQTNNESGEVYVCIMVCVGIV